MSYRRRCKTIEENLNRKPKQVVADGGFTNRATIEQMAAERD